ncbi:NAD(P)H-dependent oxidoreductase subunit E, partial [bacterium]|nr:NAD(P)H-dependent oxidoreductase subunit E [bacterium]
MQQIKLTELLNLEGEKLLGKIFMDASDTINPKNIETIIERHRGNLGGVMSILEDIQIKYSYLPEVALKLVAEKMGISLVNLYGMATFYKAFTMKPRGKHLVFVCLGTACHVRGASAIAEAFSKKLGIKPGETTADKEFTLETVACLGACALGPIVLADGRYFSQVSPSQVNNIIDKIKEVKEEKEGIELIKDEKAIPLEVSCPRCNHSLMDSQHLVDGYPSIRMTISFERKHGWIRLSSLHGSHNMESEY